MRLLIVGLLASLLVAACHQPAVDLAPLPHDAYLWQRTWPESMNVALKSAPISGAVHVLAEQWNPPAERIAAERNWPALKASGRGLIPVIRIQGALSAHTDPAGLQARVVDVVARWRAQGLSVQAVEIDHDSSTAALNAYAGWMATQRRVLPADLRLIATALPTWNDSPALRTLAASVDGFVLQVHAVEEPQRGLFDPARAHEWMTAFAKAQPKPFALALPAYGSRVSLDDAGRLLSVRSESPTLDGAGRNAQELSADPPVVADFLRSLQRERPPALQGIVWFRLPLPEDRRAWSLATWTAVVRGEPLVSKLSAMAAAPDAAGSRELWLRNEGTLDAPLPDAVHAPASCTDGDGGRAYRVQREASGLRWQREQPLRLRAGERLRIGWVRCTAAESASTLGAFDVTP